MRRFILLALLMMMAGLMARQTAAQSKSDTKTPVEIKWPKEVGGKNLETWTALVKSSKDASLRDEAVRTLPMFGPDSRKVTSANLVHAISNDPDINVRLAAISVVPFLWFDDAYVDQGMAALINILLPKNQAANHTLYETTLALGQCGPLAKRAIPTLVQYTMVDSRSWQNRKAAVSTLAKIGQPFKRADGKEDGPDVEAIRGVIKALRSDPSHMVRREAVNALLQLGPPLVEAPWRELREALTFAMMDSDKSVSIWSRVAFIRTEQDPIKPNHPQLVAISKLITSSDLAQRQEAIQALGVIGEEAKSRLSELMAIAQNDKDEPAILIMAMWSLTQMPSEAAKSLPVITRLTKHVDQNVKTAAENAVEELTKKPEPKKDKDKDPPKK